MNFDWDNFSGHKWSGVLAQHPEHAKHCDWDKLDGDDWSCLLRDRPQFAEYCDWDKLDGWDWCRLIIDQPEFIPLCEWDKLEEFEWTKLSRRPYIINALPYHVHLRAVMLCEKVIHSITDPTEQLIKMHKMKHEL